MVWHPALIPVQFHALAEVTGASSASVAVLNVNTGVTLFLDFAAGLQNPDPRPGFDRTVALSIAPTDYLRVGLSASAEAFDDNDPATSDADSSQALADPTFSFDQAAFDQYATSLGQQTFNLTDFYSFEIQSDHHCAGACVGNAVFVRCRFLSPASGDLYQQLVMAGDQCES